MILRVFYGGMAHLYRRAMTTPPDLGVFGVASSLRDALLLIRRDPPLTNVSARTATTAARRSLLRCLWSIRSALSRCWGLWGIIVGMMAAELRAIIVYGLALRRLQEV